MIRASKKRSHHFLARASSAFHFRKFRFVLEDLLSRLSLTLWLVTINPNFVTRYVKYCFCLASVKFFDHFLASIHTLLLLGLQLCNIYEYKVNEYFLMAKWLCKMILIWIIPMLKDAWISLCVQWLFVSIMVRTALLFILQEIVELQDF